MRNFYIVVLTLLAYTGYGQQKKADGAKTPPAIYILNVNGKEYSVNEGEDLKIDGNLNNPTVTVRTADYRKFDNGTISFNYKSNATYQFEETSGNKTWTFNGSDDVVFLFEMGVKVKIEAIVEQVISQFGKKNCRVETASKKIGDKMVSGKKINVTLAGQKLVQEYYDLDLSDSKTHILAFQNLKKDDGSMSKDGVEEADLVASTIKLDQRH